MVIILGFFLFFSNVAMAKSGCFRSELLNESISSQLGKPCKDFPDSMTIQNNALYLRWGEGYELHLFEEDFDRLKQIDIIYIEVTDLVIHGEVRLPDVEYFYIENTKRVNSTSGSLHLSFPELKLTLGYFDGFSELMKKSKINPAAKIVINAENDPKSDLDFLSFAATGSIEINNANSVRNGHRKLRKYFTLGLYPL